MTSLQNNITKIQDSLDDIKDAISNKSGIIVSDITSYSDNILNMFVGLNREVSSQNVLRMPSTNFSFSLPNTVNDIGNYALYYAFKSCTSLTSVDLSNLTKISGAYALYYAFSDCSSLTSVDLSSLTIISGNYALDYAFEYCASLTSVDLSSLTSVRSMGSAFRGCTSLTSVDLSSLTGANDMSNAFHSCTSLTSVDLSSLTTISGNNALSYAFGYSSLITLSFPSLTSTSFGLFTNQFNNMLASVRNCTVHFPSNLQSVIGSWSDVTAGFGGTNTTVLFDLPATT